jgi:DNA modification methylase
VLDPFGGSGTVGKVAVELGRRAILSDIAYHEDGYLELARRRTEGVQRPLGLGG